MIKLDFLKIKRKFRKNNTEPKSNLYWIIIFSLSSILIILSFILGYSIFMKINKEEMPLSPSDNKQLEKISKERIDKVLDIFSEKKIESYRIKNSSSRVVDPSL